MRLQQAVGLESHPLRSKPGRTAALRAFIDFIPQYVPNRRQSIEPQGFVRGRKPFGGRFSFWNMPSKSSTRPTNTRDEDLRVTRLHFQLQCAVEAVSRAAAVAVPAAIVGVVGAIIPAVDGVARAIPERIPGKEAEAVRIGVPPPRVGGIVAAAVVRRESPVGGDAVSDCRSPRERGPAVATPGSPELRPLSAGCERGTARDVVPPLARDDVSPVPRDVVPLRGDPLRTIRHFRCVHRPARCADGPDRPPRTPIPTPAIASPVAPSVHRRHDLPVQKEGRRALPQPIDRTLETAVPRPGMAVVAPARSEGPRGRRAAGADRGTACCVCLS